MSKTRMPRTRLNLHQLEARLAPAVFQVTAIDDSGAGSLRDAIAQANATAGADTITFSSLFNTPQTIGLSTGELLISNPVTITGPGASLLTVERTVGATGFFRMFNVNAPGVVDVGLSGMRITGGNTVGLSGGGPAGDGAGLLMFNDNVTLDGVVVTGNASSTEGGGIAVASINGGGAGFLTIRNSTISGNSANGLLVGTYGGSGGGMYFANGGSLRIENSTISGNTSVNGRGGGIYFYGDIGSGGWSVSNSTITGNSTARNGGGMCLFGYNGAMPIQNSTITGNTAVTNGGGVYFYGDAGLTIESTVIANNTGTSPDLYGVATSIRSLIRNQTGATITDGGGNLAAGVDPLFAAAGLANNGGPTQTIALQAGSPLINAGINAAFRGIDQRGFQRTAGSQVDIGAFETGAALPAGDIPSVDTVLAFGATSYQIQVTYTDDTAVNVGSIDINDLTISGPGTVTINSVAVSGSGNRVVATYTVTPPGGSWNLVDSGAYTVSSVLGQVTDTGGNGITTGIIGQFKVAVTEVINTNDSGFGSLRQAILDSNATAGLLTTIHFTIGTGPATISLASPLPAITDPVIIDAGTQPGFAGVPIVELAGNLAGAGAVGLQVSAAGTVVRGLVINRFATGIQIDDSATNAIVQGNYIGTNAAGTAGLGNAVGVALGSSNGTLIGSDLDGTNDATERNIISGNTTAGVSSSGVNAPLTLAQWTTGTGANNHYYVLTPETTWVNAENAAVASGGHLASIANADENAFVLTLGTGWIGFTDDEAYGGTEFGDTSGAANRGAGWVWTDGTPAPQPIGGYQNWQAGEPNQFNGSQEDYAETDLFTGFWNDTPNTTPFQGILEFTALPNLSALAAAFGVVPNRIQGNYIGTNAAGAAAVPNAAGLSLAGALGATVRGNVISGNTGSGVAISSAVVTGFLRSGGGVTITGNTIGSDAAGLAALGNGGAGISVNDNTGVVIGGTGAGAANTIRNNTGAGVAVIGANGNASIRGNSISSNGGLGIDLGPAGLTLNDVGDVDTGPNGLQNFPVITGATSGATTTVSGSFNGVASTAITLDFYASTTGDPSAYGEGARYLGSTVVNTDVSGNVTFTNVVLAAASVGGEIISATATDPRGNTSEFALNATASGSSAPTVLATLVNNSAGNQRSRVSSLAVTFSTAVTFAGAVANAFTLTRTGGGAIGGFTATASLNGLGQTVVILDAFTGAETTFGSLNDGNYVLTALASQISAGGTAMAANYVFGAVQSDRFYRFYGDITGDRRVDIADFGFFSAGYLQGPGANVPSLDYNQDGRLDITDFGQFSVRFFTSLP